MKFRNVVKKYSAPVTASVGTALVFSNSAFAAIDTTAVEASIGDASAAVSTIAPLVLAVVGLIFAYRMVKRAIG